MFAYLLGPMLCSFAYADPLHNHADQPVQNPAITSWPVGRAVPSTVHGVKQRAPYSQLECVYIEWAIGRIKTNNGEESWVAFEHPNASKEDLVFRSLGGDQLRVHPSVVRFYLAPSAVHRSTLQASGDHVVPHSQDHEGGRNTIKEYCLADGQKVRVTRFQEVHWLAPESSQKAPQKVRTDRYMVTTQNGDEENTPSSIVR